MVMVNLSEGSTTPQTEQVVAQVEDYLLTEESATVDSTFATLGFGFGGSGQNTAMIFVKLKDFDDREDDELAASAVATRATTHFSGLRAGQVMFRQPLAIPGLGNTSGFSMELVDYGNTGRDALIAAAEEIEALANQDGRLQNVDVSGVESEGVLKLIIDQQKAESFGVSVSEVNSILSTIFAGSSVNDFDMNGSLRPVIVMADAVYRMQPEGIEGWYLCHRNHRQLRNERSQKRAEISEKSDCILGAAMKSGR
ncbi:efflux RND transporter permease subunit [Celeribacter ethanolicus]|nr:efflux RND transporter permease subunit [Celeribacter ethanolicus]